ncbi:hypothetical protein BC831DRAFT_450553 [Entophlyctis helioformis]|nr:hypothetical protein BC831DRAFT_450553 [Entophlyctis helioformis]
MRAAAAKPPQSDNDWRLLLEPLISSLAAAIGQLHTVQLHVDGSQLDTAIKAAYAGRAWAALEAASFLMAEAAKRNAGQKSSKLSRCATCCC